MSARDRAQARQLHIDFKSNDDAPRLNGPSRSSHPGRGFTLAQRPIPNGHGGPSRLRDVPPHQQQIAQPSPMAPEQAAQQRRQVQADRQAETRRKKAFVTTLTASTQNVAETPKALGSAMISGSGYNTPREDVDEATSGSVYSLRALLMFRSRHAALLSRVSILASGSTVKLSSFRSAVRQFRNNESGAKDMIDTVYNVLDRDAEATMGVIREIADLFDDETDKEKQVAVLEAMNAFRIEVSLTGSPRVELC